MIVDVKDAPVEVWWDITHEAVVSIDGEEYSIRQNSNSHGGANLVYVDGDWLDVSELERGPVTQALEMLFDEVGVEHLGKAGDVIDL